VLREADAVVGHAVLREVVGADLLGAVARADLRAARVALGRRALLLLDVVELRAQELHGHGLVLVLRLLLLAVHDEPRRDVVDAHGRVGRVDGLAARAARAHDVDLEVLGIDLDLDVLDLRHDGHRRRRGVDASLRLGRGHALHAVHARLVLELREGALAVDADDHLAQAARRGARAREQLDLPAPPLGEARVHAEEIGGEQGRLLAARAGADLEQDVLVVVGILGHEQHLHLLLEHLLLREEVLLLLVRHVAHLRVLLQLARVVGAAHDLAVLAQLLDELAQIRVLLREALQLALVGEHGRVAEHRRELVVAGLDGGELPEEELVKHGDLSRQSAGPNARAVSIRRSARASRPSRRQRTSC
jgi:hypothetical protein